MAHSQDFSDNLSQDAPSSDVQAQDLLCYQFYENMNFEYFREELDISHISANEILRDLYDIAFDQITEKYFRGKTPGHISQEIICRLEIGLECNYKQYDKDNDQDLSRALESDEKPVTAALDSWARARLKNAEFRHIPDELEGVVIPNYQDQMRKDLRKANEARKEFLFNVDKESLPDFIHLQERKDLKVIEDQRLRKQKLNELEEIKKQKRALKNEEELKKKNAKLLSNAGTALKRNQRITYNYDGSVIVISDITSNKLSEVLVNPLQTLGFLTPRTKQKDMEKEIQTAITLIDEVKKQIEGKEKIELPGIKLKTQAKATEELLSSKTAVTHPIYLTEHIDMASGCTLIENGKPKASTKKQVFKFENKNIERMNRTEYSAKYNQYPLNTQD